MQPSRAMKEICSIPFELVTSRTLKIKFYLLLHQLFFMDVYQLNSIGRKQRGAAVWLFCVAEHWVKCAVIKSLFSCWSMWPMANVKATVSCSSRHTGCHVEMLLMKDAPAPEEVWELPSFSQKSRWPSFNQRSSHVVSGCVTRLRGKSRQTWTKREEKAPPRVQLRSEQMSNLSCSVLWMWCRAVVPLSSDWFSSGALPAAVGILEFLNRTRNGPTLKAPLPVLGRILGLLFQIITEPQ